MGLLPPLFVPSTPPTTITDINRDLIQINGHIEKGGVYIQTKDLEQVIRWLIMKYNSQFDNLPMVLAQIKGTQQFLIIPQSLPPLIAILKESGRLKIPYALAELSKALQTLNYRLEPEVYQFFAVNDVDVTIIS